VQRIRAALLVPLADVERTLEAQPSQLGNFAVCAARLNLPLVPRIWRQRSHIGRFYQADIKAYPGISILSMTNQ